MGGGLLAGGSSCISLLEHSIVRQNHAIEDIYGGGLGGGIIVFGNATVLIDNSVVHGNVASQYGGGVSAQGNATVLVKNGSSILGNMANATGGGFDIAHYSHIQINDSIVQDNYAARGTSSHGGGLYLWDDCIVTVRNSKFLSNKADGSGGAFYISDSAHVSIVDSVFRSNNASEGDGGAILASGRSNVSIEASSFVRNAANAQGKPVATSSGGALCAIANATVVISNRSTFYKNKVLAGYGGGALAAWFNSVITIIGQTNISENTAWLGHGGGVLLGESARVTVSDGSTLVRNTATGPNAKGGGVSTILEGKTVAVLRDVTFSGNSAAYLGDDIHAVGDQSLDLSNSNINAACESVFWTRTERCLLGEVRDARTQTCQLCQGPLAYSLNPKMTTCDKCPDNANCSLGHLIVPLPGFWHSSLNSTRIHRCPRGDSCTQGFKPTNTCTTGYNPTSESLEQCANGYFGHVCASCDVGSGYGSYKPFHCKECSGVVYAAAVYATGGLALLFFMAWTVKSTLRDNARGNVEVCAADYIKVLVRHGQYLLIMSNLTIDWPPALASIFKFCAWFFSFNSSGLVSLDCILSSSGNIPLAIRVLLVYLFAPFGFMLLLVLGWVFAYARDVGLRNWNSEASNRCKTVVKVCLLITMVFFYPSWVRVGVSFFACYDLDNIIDGRDPYPQYAMANAPHGYWVADMKQACFEGWHLTWALGLGLPCIVGFCIGVPLGIWLLLLFNRERLDDPHFKQVAGFLYQGYRNPCFFWESVSLVQMMVQVVIAVFSFSALGPFYSALLLNISFAVFIILLLLFSPHDGRDSSSIAGGNNRTGSSSGLAVQVTIKVTPPTAVNTSSVLHRRQRFGGRRQLSITHLLSMNVLYFTTCFILTLFSSDWKGDTARGEAHELYASVVGVIAVVLNGVFMMYGLLQAVVLGWQRAAHSRTWSRVCVAFDCVVTWAAHVHDVLSERLEQLFIHATLGLPCMRD
jgi:hypothetical protein